MAIKSNRAGKCYDCGTEWKEGEEIDANGHKTKAGKDYWCKMGKNCTRVTQSVSVTSLPPPWDGPAKLIDTQSVSVPGSGIPLPSQSKGIPQDWTPKILTIEEAQVWNGILDKLMEYDMAADKRFASNGSFDSSNPAHTGQIKNWAIQVLNAIHSRKAEEDE